MPGTPVGAIGETAKSVGGCDGQDVVERQCGGKDRDVIDVAAIIARGHHGKDIVPSQRSLEGLPVVGTAAAERHRQNADIGLGGAVHQRAHSGHVGARIAKRHKGRARCLARQHRRHRGAVADRQERTARDIAVIGPPIHIPVIVADRNTVPVAGQTVAEDGEIIGQTGIDKSDPDAAGIGSFRPWRLQGLGPAQRFEITVQLVEELPGVAIEPDGAAGLDGTAAIGNGLHARLRLVAGPGCV